MAFRYCGFADEASREPREQLAVTKQAGWKAIEVRMAGAKNVCDFTPDEWRAFWALFQEARVSIPCFGSQLCNWARPITTDFQVDVAELRRAAPYMREAGCKIIRVMSYPNAKKPWPLDQWRKEAARRLRELATIAEGEGVILGHENCSGYGGLGPQQYLELAAVVNSPAFKLIFDTGNNTEHDQDPEATWRYYEATRAHIVHVHIKAYKRGADGKMATCFPDDDPVQRRLLADLKQRKYKGWLSIEPHLNAVIHAGKDIDDKDKAKAVYVEYARRLTALVKSL